MQFALKQIPVTDDVIAYAVELVRKTRPNTADGSDLANNYLNWGAGPRASQNLILAAKALAMMNGDGSPSITHVRKIAQPVLRHRIVANFKAKGEGLLEDDIIGQLL